MIRIASTALLLASLALSANAQCTPQLSMSGGGHRGTMMAFTMTGGMPNAPAMMGISGQMGSTSFPFGHMGTLNLGLAQPMMFAHMGLTSPTGSVHMSVQVPHGMMHRMQMYAQGFMAMMNMHSGGHHHGGMQMQLTFCTSNVMGFMVGGNHMMP